jgi:hypothetical protein
MRLLRWTGLSFTRQDPSRTTPVRAERCGAKFRLAMTPDAQRGYELADEPRQPVGSNLPDRGIPTRTLGDAPQGQGSLRSINPPSLKRDKQLPMRAQRQE